VWGARRKTNTRPLRSALPRPRSHAPAWKLIPVFHRSFPNSAHPQFANPSSQTPVPKPQFPNPSSQTPVRKLCSPLVPKLCLGTHLGGKLRLQLSGKGSGKETELPRQIRARTEFGHEQWKAPAAFTKRLLHCIRAVV